MLIVRSLAVVLLVQILLQAVLAGAFVSGRVSLLDLHTLNGILLVLTSAALLPAAVLLVRPGRGPWWPIVFSVVFWFLIATQVGFGFARQVGLHFPLGMAVFGMICGFTWWALAHRPAAVAPAPAPATVTS